MPDPISGMSLADQIIVIAAGADAIPEAALAQLRRAAAAVQRIERALDDIAEDARQDERRAFADHEAKERAIQRGEVVRFPRKISLHMTGGTAA